MSTRSRSQPWFRNRVTMKELVAKLDADNYDAWEMKQLFTGPFFTWTESPVVVMRDPVVASFPGKRWPAPMRDRRGRFTTPGKPEC